MQRDNSLINIRQIEGGIDLVTKLAFLQKIIEEIDLEKYRLKSQCIMYNDIDPFAIEEIYNTIMENILGTDGTLKVNLLENLELKLKNFEMILETCRKYNDPLTDIERDMVLQTVIDDVRRIINSVLENYLTVVNNKIEQSEEKLFAEIARLEQEIDKQNAIIGNLENLNPFILNAINPNLNIVDIINLLFQLIIDKNSYGELPKVFELPDDYNSILDDTIDIDYLEDNSLGLTKDKIIYRKDLGNLNISNKEEGGTK